MSISGAVFGKRDWTAEVSVCWPGSLHQQEVGKGRRGGEETQRWHVDSLSSSSEKEMLADFICSFSCLKLEKNDLFTRWLLFDVDIDC